MLSKLTECLVVCQLSSWTTCSPPTCCQQIRADLDQATLQKLSDILLTVDCGDVAVLIVLDFSAAFNTVDYEIVAASTYHLRHQWRFTSYPLGQSQYVRTGTSCWSIINLIQPQGSVLGLILFILYTTGLTSLIKSHGLTPHLYADGSQVYGPCPLTKVYAFSTKLTACSCAIASRMQSNRLQLNSDKTEVLIWRATTRRQHQLPRSPLLVDRTPINPV